MAEVALAALYRTVRNRLIASSEIWGTKAFPDLAPAKTERPYVVFSYAGGGELNARVSQDAEIVLTIKIISTELGQALYGAQRISSLFNDADLSRAGALDAGSEWVIIHVKQEQIVHMVEMVEGVQVYHDGNRFRFRMERI